MLKKAAIAAMMLVVMLPAAAVTASADGLVGAPTGADANPHAYIDAQGVTHYAFDPESMPGNSTRMQQGVRESDGSCTFTLGGSGSAAANARTGGPKVTVGTETTYDPSLCLRQLAEATYLANEVPAAAVERFASASAMGSSGGEPGRGLLGSAATTYWYGALNGVYSDPIPAVVTRTESSLGWTSAGATYHWNGYYYLSGTGWSMTYYSPVNSSTSTNTRANFKNTAFCNPLLSTYTNHTRDEFRGYADGTWDWGWTSSKSGDCASLLSSGYYLETP